MHGEARLLPCKAIAAALCLDLSPPLQCQHPSLPANSSPLSINDALASRWFKEPHLGSRFCCTALKAAWGLLLIVSCISSSCICCPCPQKLCKHHGLPWNVDLVSCRKTGCKKWLTGRLAMVCWRPACSSACQILASPSMLSKGSRFALTDPEKTTGSCKNRFTLTSSSVSISWKSAGCHLPAYMQKDTDLPQHAPLQHGYVWWWMKAPTNMGKIMTT